MGVKIPPCEVLRQEIFRLLGEGLEAVNNPLDTFISLAVRLMLQTCPEFSDRRA